MPIEHLLILKTIFIFLAWIEGVKYIITQSQNRLMKTTTRISAPSLNSILRINSTVN